MKSTFRLGLLALTLLTLANCGSEPTLPTPPPQPSPTRIILDIQAATDVNPGPGDQPLPLAVKIYQLKNTGAFNGADFFSLYEEPDATLGAALVAHEEVVVKPGGSTLLERTLEESTRHLGLVAAYRNLDEAVWRATVPTPSQLTTPVKIQLNKNTMNARVASH